jgi:hypothetical protein
MRAVAPTPRDSSTRYARPSETIVRSKPRRSSGATRTAGRTLSTERPAEIPKRSGVAA